MAIRSVLAAAAAAVALACGPAAPVEQETDGPEPEGELIGQVSDSLTVEQAIGAGCSTSSVAGLSEQIVGQMNCLIPNALAAVPERPNLTRTSATFPFLQTPARDALVGALDASPGRSLRATSMLRTVAQQYILYRWSKQGRCGVSLAATPGRSNHESGLALDTGDYSSWRGALEARGFEWFGSRDRVHFDFRGSGRTDLKGVDVRAFQILWNANHPDDRIAEDGAYGPQTGARLARAPAGGFAIGPSCGVPEPEPEPVATGRALGVVWDRSTAAAPSAAESVRIETATVSAGDRSVAVRAGDAFWQIELPPGSHTLAASAPGYRTATRTIDVVAGGDAWASMGLLPEAAEVTARLAVTDEGGGMIEDAIVWVPGVGAQQAPAGVVVLEVEPGHHEVQAFAAGYDGATASLDVSEAATSFEIELAPATPSPTGRLQGVVWDASRASSASASAGARVDDAIVVCSCGLATAARAGDAYWRIDAPAGTHEITVVAPGFRTASFTRTVTRGASSWGSVGLDPE